MPDGTRHPTGGRAAFSLVELLVVLAVIGVVVALALPALSRARRSARDALCLSNLRQLGLAWAAYTDDYRNFPVADIGDFAAKARFAWGGVHWYADADRSPGLALPSVRPLNAYVAEHERIETRSLYFRCPNDDGARTPRFDVNSWELIAGDTASGEPGTCYGVAGTSYECNEWMYCEPGSMTGYSAGAAGGASKYRPRQGPAQVQVSPSRFVVLQDIAPANWVRTPMSRRPYLWGGWWHGAERTHMAFLDGSARRTRSGLMASPEYSLHMTPMRHPNASWVRPTGQ